MKYIIEYDIAAIVITLTIVFSFFRKKSISTKLTKAFTIITTLHLLSSILDLVTVYTIENPHSVPVWLNYIVNMVFFTSLNGVAIAFFNTILFVIEEKKRSQEKFRKLTYIPFVAEVILIFTTPLTKGIFYFDANLVYHHGILYNLLYVLSLFYLVLCVLIIIRDHIFLSKSQILTIIFYTIAMFVTVYLQSVFPKLLIINFISAISLLLTYLSLENPANYTDKEMGIFNRRAFLIIANQKINSGKSIRIIGFQIAGLKYLNETIGLQRKSQLLQNISDLLIVACGNNPLYRLSESKVAVIINDDEKKEKHIIDRIKIAFAEPFRVDDFSLSMGVRITTLVCPEQAKDVDNAIDLIENMLQNLAEKENGTTAPADKDLLEKISREHTIAVILKTALKNKEFFVVYQPIYCVEKNEYTTAEALVRLKHKDFGFIRPDEFIPIAERCGLILEIGEFVFNSVCEFILHEKIWEKGIEYIHVNLSVIQCMQEKLHQQLFKIMDSCGLDYKYINLEVTETSAIASSEILKSNMTKLIEKNVNFSLDDFGTGFSNMSTLVEYPFHTIKLDKSIIDSAFRDEKARIILLNTIKMVKELKMQIVAEGVETEEQAHDLKEMGCDYIQGFFYSKPIGQEEFLELLK